MTTNLPMKREFGTVIMSDSRLQVFENEEEFARAMRVLAIHIDAILEANPRLRDMLLWPPQQLVFSRDADPSVSNLYQALSDALVDCGYSIAALTELTLISHTPKRATAFKVPEHARLYPLH